MSKTYEILVPITGTVLVTVTADSEKEALEKVWEVDVGDDDIQGWEMHEKVVRGNVFYGSQNEIEIVTEYDEDE